MSDRGTQFLLPDSIFRFVKADLSTFVMQNSRTMSIATSSPSRMEPLCATGHLRLTGSCSPVNIASPAPHGPGLPRQDPSVKAIMLDSGESLTIWPTMAVLAIISYCSWSLTYKVLPFTDMSWHGSSEETTFWVTCEYPYVQFNENSDCKTMKMLLSCFACYKQFDWPKKVIAIFIISLHLYIFRGPGGLMS